MTRIRYYLLGMVIACSCIGCAIAGTTGQSIPEKHLPSQAINDVALEDYVLAYCWRSSAPDALEAQRVDIVVVTADTLQEGIIVYPALPPQSSVSIGCLGPGTTFPTLGSSLTWRPKHEQLTAIVGTLGSPGDSFYFVGVENLQDIDLPVLPMWEYDRFFQHPSALSWSPEGDWLATVAEDADGAMGWQNIWLYNPDNKQGLRLTNERQLSVYAHNLAWSSNRKYIAVGYQPIRSGIAVIRLEDQTLTEINSENESVLLSWPYASLSTLKSSERGYSLDPREQFQSYLYSNSRPVWMEQDQQIAFVAPAQGERVALFVASLTDMHVQELVPGMPGLVGLPILSPDQTRLAFVRYPGWSQRDRAEIALLTLRNNVITSLIVLPAPPNDDELYISGLDWAPDGKYLAFSSNHDGESDVYILSVDGQAWFNLTDALDGDAVNPIWRP